MLVVGNTPLSFEGRTNSEQTPAFNKMRDQLFTEDKSAHNIVYIVFIYMVGLYPT